LKPTQLPQKIPILLVLSTLTRLDAKQPANTACGFNRAHRARENDGDLIKYRPALLTPCGTSRRDQT
jgi:hypothetical protein